MKKQIPVFGVKSRKVIGFLKKVPKTDLENVNTIIIKRIKKLPGRNKRLFNKKDKTCFAGYYSVVYKKIVLYYEDGVKFLDVIFRLLHEIKHSQSGWKEFFKNKKKREKEANDYAIKMMEKLGYKVEIIDITAG